MITEQSIWQGTTADYLINPKGHLLDRLTPHTDWWNARYQEGVDPYSKASIGPILSEGEATDRKGHSLKGVNLASQDYLALSSHPNIKQAAMEAVQMYGVHSAGSPALMGNSELSVKLEDKLAEFVDMESCTVFPTGWAAGYGVISALVKPDDFILMDHLSHACLAEGARNATKNLHIFPHLSTSALERKLKSIRGKNPSAGILIVTESLFSMDSDTPDIAKHQALADQYNATLMVDVAHDLGCMGRTGRGHLEEQGMLGKVDIVMGSFSKTFASNGGFAATNHPALKLALRYGSCPLSFSNAISPVQAAVVLEALNIIQSGEGAHRRQNMINNSIYLRRVLAANDFEVMGAPSAIIPVLLGGMKRSRLITRETLQGGGLVNLVEYPAVSRRNSRFRLQVMASHTYDQLDRFMEILIQARNSMMEPAFAV